MNRVIILEGPDGAGKTTLAETLRDRHGFIIQHTNKPVAGQNSQELFGEYVNSLWQALIGGQSVVFDRHYVGEQVYGPVMRNISLLNDQQVQFLDWMIQTLDVRLIFVLPPWEVVRQNWLHKVADYIPSEGKLLAIYERYMTEANSWGDGGKHRYDYTGTDGGEGSYKHILE